MLTAAQLEGLDRDGYAVVPDFLDFHTTARLRAHMDGMLPPVQPRELGGGEVRTLRHPIPGAIMAEVLTPRAVALARQALHTDRVRLLEQVLIRTDPSRGEPGPTGWHVDMAFHPSHFFTAPRLTYFHFVHALNTIPPGRAAFTIVPGSHRLNYDATRDLGSPEELAEFRNDAAKRAGIDTTRAIEVPAREGDLIIFNPMCLHSASRNVSDAPRYVYFASFADPA